MDERGTDLPVILASWLGEREITEEGLSVGGGSGGLEGEGNWLISVVAYGNGGQEGYGGGHWVLEGVFSPFLALLHRQWALTTISTKLIRIETLERLPER